MLVWSRLLHRPSTNFFPQRFFSSKIVAARACGREVEVQLAAGIGDHHEDQKLLRFPYSFLRDNCPSNFHPTTLMRISAMDHARLTSRVEHVDVSADGSALEVFWSGGEDGEEQEEVGRSAKYSSFSVPWLEQHSLRPPDRMKRSAADVAKIASLDKQKWWNGDPDVRAIDFTELSGLKNLSPPNSFGQNACKNNNALFRLFDQLWRYGLVYLKNLPPAGEGDLDAVRWLGSTISWLRPTNYGTTFQVRSKPDPNNQAYTNRALFMHTDLPYYNKSPDIQILHCISQAGHGGESRFVDGVAAANILRKQNPAAFELLTKKKVRFSDRNLDNDYYLWAEKPLRQSKK